MQCHRVFVCICLTFLLAVLCSGANSQNKVSLVWTQVAGSMFTRYAPNELISREVVAAVDEKVGIDYHNITDILYAALDHSGRGVSIGNVYDRPPSKVLFAPITLPTEIVRIPTLRKRLFNFMKNVSIACKSEYSIVYAPYQHVRVPTGIEDFGFTMDELWVSSPDAVKQLATRGVPPAKLHVLPPAIDTSMFGPHVTPAAVPLPPRCTFTMMSLVEGRWGSGIIDVVTAFTRAFGTRNNLVKDACLVLLDTTRNTPFERMRSMVFETALAEGIDESMFDNVVVAHADVNNPSVHPARLLRVADLVVVPTRDGVVGTTVMDAMATGKTVFTTRWGEQAAAISHGVTGYVIGCSEGRVTHETPLLEADERAGMFVGAQYCIPDADTLSSLFIEAKASPQKLLEIGANARAYALQHFDKHLFAQRVAERLSSVNKLGLM